MSVTIDDLRPMFPQWSDDEIAAVLQTRTGNIEEILADLLARPVSDAHLARFLSETEATDTRFTVVAPLPIVAPLQPVEPPTYNESVQPRPRRRHQHGIYTPLLD